MDELKRMREKRKGDDNSRSNYFEDTSFSGCVTPRLGIERYGASRSRPRFAVDGTLPSLPMNASPKALRRFRTRIIFLVSLPLNPSHLMHPLLSNSSRLSSNDSLTLRHVSSSSLPHRLPCDTFFTSLYVPRRPPTLTQHYRLTLSRRAPPMVDPRQRS